MALLGLSERPVSAFSFAWCSQLAVWRGQILMEDRFLPICDRAEVCLWIRPRQPSASKKEGRTTPRGFSSLEDVEAANARLLGVARVPRLGVFGAHLIYGIAIRTACGLRSRWQGPLEGHVALMREPPETTKFFQRIRVIIDAQVDGRKRRFGPDANGAGLTAPLVSTRPFASFHRNDETFVEIEVRRCQICLQGLVNYPRSSEHVPRDGDVGVNDAAAPVDTCRTGVGCRASFAIDQMNLPVIAPIIRRQQSRDYILR